MASPLPRTHTGYIMNNDIYIYACAPSWQAACLSQIPHQMCEMIQELHSPPNFRYILVFRAPKCMLGALKHILPYFIVSCACIILDPLNLLAWPRHATSRKSSRSCSPVPYPATQRTMLFCYSLCSFTHIWLWPNKVILQVLFLHKQ